MYGIPLLVNLSESLGGVLIKQRSMVLHFVQTNRSYVYGVIRVLFMFSRSLFLEPRKLPDIGLDHTHLNTEIRS